ncbi:glycerol-3-phosphate dehydrogenase [Vibrio ponticus]|uniref:Glycerol-3-phosphate dehydrogenase n=1 Tax=Vibrio ponticus TaxID=265668 RepID=A0ABX3F4G0_9VIBR|nr:glycerol-3-phosphate dehydrogenase [Vibrio ponticus]OLQ84853.1 glycerol-3-phosphate dehydrogenase [Vibrio ponticus]
MVNHDEFPTISAPLDVIVIGGGINGAGIASEAASRGLTVGLYEAKDFAVATSSASSKLIHGGLRYLEQFKFRLVREALAEREILLNKASHIIKPMRFRLPHHSALRPKWLIKTGLFLYDHLARRSILKPSKTIQLNREHGLQPSLSTAFEYSDCWVDDSRLVIANVKQAHQYGAEVRNYCEVLSVRRDGDLWHVELYDSRLKSKAIRHCRAVVNATGPWAAQFLEQRSEDNSPYQMQLVKGSHLIVDKLYAGEEAYILQSPDKRVVFVIPYLDKYTMIGTTDIPFSGDPYQVTTSDQEIEYLLDVCNQNFSIQLSPPDVISSFSGVRPLFGDSGVDAQNQSRDYQLVSSIETNLPLLTVYGGKLTTYRKLAQKAVDQLKPFFTRLSPSNSEHTVFNEADGLDCNLLQRQVATQFPSLATETITRLIDLYGVEVWQVLNAINDNEAPLIADVYQGEIDYLVQNEWALCVEDIFYRRTKLCYQTTAAEREVIAKYLA